MTQTPIPIGIAVVQRGDEFLIGQRPEGAALAGLWEFPGGKVENGETPEQTAARECLEEAGIAIEVQSRYPDSVQLYDHGRVRLYFFACRPILPEQEPHIPFRWVPREQLSQFPFPEGNRKLLQILTMQ